MDLRAAALPAPQRTEGAASLAPVAGVEPSSVTATPAAFSPGRPLRPADALQLQRTHGNRAFQRRLQRQAALVQRDEGEPAETPAADPPADTDREKRLAEARASLLEAAQRDSILYMARCGNLLDDLREPLFQDDALTAGLRSSFHGKTLMIARVRVRYRSQPSFVRQFTQAVGDHDIQRISDLLRASPELREPRMGVLAVLDAELSGDPALPELRRLAQEQAAKQGEVAGTASSAKYLPPEDKKGKPIPGRAPEIYQNLTSFHFQLERTGSELRVLVRIRFLRPDPTVPGARQSTSPPTDKLTDWRSGIEKFWNNRFQAVNKTARLKVVFVPIWNAEEKPDYEFFYAEGVGQSGSAKNGTWYSIADGTIIAHEFGHLVGNPDEYDIPAKIEDIPADYSLSKEERERSNYKSLSGGKDAPHPGGKGNAAPDSMMGDYGQVHQRHLWQVLKYFNQEMKLDGEEDFWLEGGVK